VLPGVGGSSSLGWTFFADLAVGRVGDLDGDGLPELMLRRKLLVRGGMTMIMM
jgi:hypothetical protein